MNSAASDVTNQLAFRCGVCSRPVFFDNTRCVACDTPLGYIIERGVLDSLAPLENERWHPMSMDADATFLRCANFDSAAICNWMIPAIEWDAGQTFCRACRLNRTIPDQNIADNAVYWHKIEMAKRRLVAALVALHLPVLSKVSEDRERGLAFDFLQVTNKTPQVMTGHDEGVITLNVNEASDAAREQIRVAMHEPYRTLLGHLRHEVGHYYWDRLIMEGPWLEEFRQVFGDERADYATALTEHYERGAPADWGMRFVSSYASAHPWEDWAETWAHYLHMLAVQDTAWSFGLDASAITLNIDPFVAEGGIPNEAFVQRINTFTTLTSVLNEFSRSMGSPDLYPFVLSRAVVIKLAFVDQVIHAQRTQPAPPQPSEIAIEPSLDMPSPAPGVEPPSNDSTSQSIPSA